MTTLTHRFSVADFYRMAESGILREDDRVELIAGEIKDMMPIGPFHATLVDKLNMFFGDQRRGRFQVRVQNPLKLDDHTLLQPDLVLLKCRADYYSNGAPSGLDSFLVVEVSDSSLKLDQREKLPLYARAGIEEVWLINVAQRQVEVYSSPNYLGYSTTTVLKTGQSLSPAAFPDITIDVGVLFN